jgi:hypothetical protein
VPPRLLVDPRDLSRISRLNMLQAWTIILVGTAAAAEAAAAADHSAGYRLVPGCGRKLRDSWPNGRLPAECAPASQLAAVRCCSEGGARPSCTSPCSLEVQSSTQATMISED